MTPSRNPYGLTLCPTAHLFQALQHHGYVARPLADLRRPPVGTRLPPAKRRSVVDPRPRHHQVLRDGLPLFRVGHRGVQDLDQGAVGLVRREGQDAPGILDVLPPDQVNGPPQLPRRDPDVFGDGFRFHIFLSVLRLPADPSSVSHLSVVLRSVWCPLVLKIRVTANSPSLWPTIDSVTNTGTCFLPSWTAMVWPTISGTIVDRRDHVLITRLSPRRFISTAFDMSFTSTASTVFYTRSKRDARAAPPWS